MSHSVHSIEDAAAQAIQALGAVLDVHTLCITMQDLSGHRLIGVRSRHDRPIRQGDLIPLPLLMSSDADETADAESFVSIPDMAADARTAQSPLVAEHGFHSLLLAADARKTERIGALPVICLLDVMPLRLEQPQLDALHAMAALLGYVAELENASLTDSLTGLYNRRYLNHLYQNGADKHYSVLFIDIDDFKEVNDRFGHDIGDAVLQQIAERLRHNVRKSDVLIRYGGDEFIILFQYLADDGEMRIVADKIQNSLIHPITIEERTIRIGASIGIGSDFDGGRSLRQLITDADQAMYSMKQKDDSLTDHT